MSDGIVFFGLFSQQFAGRFFSGRQIAGKGAKTGRRPGNLPRGGDIYRLKVAQIGNKSYFCSLKDCNFKEIRC